MFELYNNSSDYESNVKLFIIRVELYYIRIKMFNTRVKLTYLLFWLNTLLFNHEHDVCLLLHACCVCLNIEVLLVNILDFFNP